MAIYYMPIYIYICIWPYMAIYIYIYIWLYIAIYCHIYVVEKYANATYLTAKLKLLELVYQLLCRCSMNRLGCTTRWNRSHFLLNTFCICTKGPRPPQPPQFVKKVSWLPCKEMLIPKLLIPRPKFQTPQPIFRSGRSKWLDWRGRFGLETSSRKLFYRKTMF